MSEYHTSNDAYGAGERDVFHNWDGCDKGRDIERRHRTEGRGNDRTGNPRSLCYYCSRHQLELVKEAAQGVVEMINGLLDE
jgi:hypothetical protein